MTPRLQTIAGVSVYALTLVALVVLALAGHDDNITEVLTLAGPVVAALLINGQIAGRLTPIHAAVTKIDEQTNGVLDQRIKTATTDAMRGFMATYATDNTVRRKDSSGTAT